MRAPSRAALLCALFLQGCDPPLDGPQLGKVPPGLALMTAMDSARHPLPHRRKLRQIGYWEGPASPGEHHAVITVYEAGIPLAEAEESRAEYAARYPSERYGPILTLRVGRRRAVGWLITEPAEGPIRARSLVAVVPHDGATYAIEYVTHGRQLRSEDELREVVGSFFVADSRRASGKVYLASGLLLAVLTAALGFRHLRDRGAGGIAREEAPPGQR